MKQRILSLIIALGICVTSIPCMTANAQEGVGSNELSSIELAGNEDVSDGNTDATATVKAVVPDSGDDDDEVSKYYILKGQQLFFEDFEGEDLNSAYTPSASQFEVTTDSQGDKALCVNAIGATLATGTFGPECTNYLVEADVKLADTNAGRNGGFFMYVHPLWCTFRCGRSNIKR